MPTLKFRKGPVTILCATTGVILVPKWLIEKFLVFQLPEDIEKEYGVALTPQAKRKILGENAAGLYGIDIAERTAQLSGDKIGVQLAAAK